MTAPRKGRSLEKENVAVDVVSPTLGWGAPEDREGGELRPESPPHCPSSVGAFILATSLGRPGPLAPVTGIFLPSAPPSPRRRTRVLSGGLLGPLGHRGPLAPRGPAGEEAGLPPSREAGQAWAGPPARGRTVLGSSLEEELVAAAGGAGAEGPLISLELEIPPLPIANPR